MARMARWGAIALISASCLSGCATEGGYRILDEAQEDTDAVPDAVLDVLDMSDYDLGSSRLSATDDGVEYFLIQPIASAPFGAPCLLVASDNPFIGCGGVDGSVEVGGPSTKDAQLVPAPAVDGDGWTAISDNVRVRDDSK